MIFPLRCAGVLVCFLVGRRTATAKVRCCCTAAHVRFTALYCLVLLPRICRSSREVTGCSSTVALYGRHYPAYLLLRCQCIYRTFQLPELLSAISSVAFSLSATGILRIRVGGGRCCDIYWAAYCGRLTIHHKQVEGGLLQQLHPLCGRVFKVAVGRSFVGVLSCSMPWHK